MLFETKLCRSLAACKQLHHLTDNTVEQITSHHSRAQHNHNHSYSHIATIPSYHFPSHHTREPEPEPEIVILPLASPVNELQNPPSHLRPRALCPQDRW